MKRINIFLATALILLGVACCVVSTYATINPISMSFKGQVKYIMVALFVIVQISVFFLAMTKHHIEREAPQHYLLVSRISNLLMIVSIVSTITFFNMNKHIVNAHSESVKELFNIIPYVKNLAFYDWLVNVTTNMIFTWSVCVLLDVMAIKLPPVGFDLLAGIKHKRRQHSLLGMILAILMYKPKTLIESKYKELYELQELAQKVNPVLTHELVQEVKTELESPKKAECVNSANSNVLTLKKGLTHLENKVKRYISERYENGDTVNVKEIRDKFNLTIRQWADIRDNLSILSTKGTKTLVAVKQKEEVISG